MSNWQGLWLNSPLNKAEERELNFERMELLHSNALLAAVIYSLNSLVITTYLYLHGEKPIIIIFWLSCFQVMAFMMLKNWYNHKGKERPNKPPSRLCKQALMNATAGGCVWGGFLISFFDNTTVIGQFLIIIVIVGTVAGAINMLYSIPAAAVSFVILSLTLPIIYTLFVNTFEYIYFALVTIIFTGFLILSTRNSYLNLIKTVRLRIGFSQLAKREHAANQAKSMFMTNMSHELRTPLNAIIGFSDLMNNEVFGKIPIPQYEKYILDIYSSGRHLMDLVDEVFELSLIETNQIEIKNDFVFLSDVIRDCLVNFEESAANKKISINNQFSQSHDHAYVDEKKIKRVLSNLIKNAINFTPSGGQISVSGHEDEDKGHVIDITDTGCGIEKDRIHQILYTFGQVDGFSTHQGKGAGFGLSIARALVELHGGRIIIQSEVNVGTMVRVTLPKAVCLIEKVPTFTSNKSHVAKLWENEEEKIKRQVNN